MPGDSDATRSAAPTRKGEPHRPYDGKRAPDLVRYKHGIRTACIGPDGADQVAQRQPGDYAVDDRAAFAMPSGRQGP